MRGGLRLPFEPKEPRAHGKKADARGGADKQGPQGHIHTNSSRSRRDEEEGDKDAHDEIPPDLQPGEIGRMVGEKHDHAFAPDLHRGVSGEYRANASGEGGIARRGFCYQDVNAAHRCDADNDEEEDMQRVHKECLQMECSVCYILQ